MPRVSMIRCLLIGCLLSISLSSIGCEGKKPTVPAIPAASVRTETTYELEGEVVSIDPKAGSVTIHHEAIPGFMPAMTMPFTLEDPKEIASLKVDDVVKGSLWVVRESGNVLEFKLSDLELVSRPITLEMGDGEASLTTKPKRLAVGDLVPDFAMTTQDGKPLKLSDLRGKLVVLTFVYTRCPDPDFCPLLDKKFAAVADRLSAIPERASKVRLLSVSFDPEHDTPDMLRKHAAMCGAKEPLWTFAVAAHTELAKAAPGLGLSYGPRPDQIIHNLTTAIIDVNGRLVQLETGKGWTPANLLETIYSQIARSRE